MIEIVKICKSFDDSDQTFHALRDVSFSVKKGEFVLIKGESGSGKSTLLSVIATIMKPTSGRVNVDGENVVSLSDAHASNYRKTKIGFITQNFHLFEELNVRENLLAPLVLNDLSPQKINEKMDRALKLANISHKQDQKVATLSGGEKQRCVIARALVNDPDVIICDEPTANLDVENSLLFIQTLKELKIDSKTLMVSTHDPLFDDLSFVDRVFHLKEGSLE